MNRIKAPLFWKFTLISTIIVLVFGSINIYMLWNTAYSSFENEIDKRCKVLARIVADKAINPIVYDSYLNLYNALDEIKQSDPDVAYIFIATRNNEILAHTSDFNVPHGLIEINSIKSTEYSIKVINAKNYNHSAIRDIAYPVVNAQIGIVRIGIAEDSIRFELIKATKKILLMMSAFFFIGLLGAFFFSYIITSPIKEISKMIQTINLNSIETGDDIQIFRSKRTSFSYRFLDELDFLVSKFSEMLMRLKSSYSELKVTQKSLIQAEKLASLGTLSAGVAHEINNPISGIKNCISRILKKPENTERNREYLFLIKDATEKIENVVKRLLKFSRKHEIIFNKINLIDVVDGAILLSQFQLKKNEIIISKVFEKKEHYINGSYNHLEQVVLNLILNSIDAIVEKKKQKKNMDGVISFIIEEDGNQTLLRVSDNGVGIPEKLRSKVFDPFFTIKDVGKGTGLGLSVSFNLISEHGGELFLNNDVESGTEFVVRLPKN